MQEVKEMGRFLLIYCIGSLGVGGGLIYVTIHALDQTVALIILSIIVQGHQI